MTLLRLRRLLLPRRLLLLLTLLGRSSLSALLMSVGTAELEQVEQIGSAIGAGSHVGSVAVVHRRRGRRRQMVHGYQLRLSL